MALEIFARQSLAQFIKIYDEVVEGTSNIPGADLSVLMWESINKGPTIRSSVKLPWNLVKKVKCQLPYLPEFINYTGCNALKKADGLYVPCGGKCDGDAHMCQSCTKSEAKFGMIEDRGLPGTYTDPSDKHEITYGTWLAKHDKTIEEVHQMLNEAGFTLIIPESYLTVNSKRVIAKKRPGRPGASKTKTSDSDSEDEADEEKPKAKKSSSSGSESDSSSKKKATKKVSESESSDEETTFVSVTTTTTPATAITFEQINSEKPKKKEKKEKNTDKPKETTKEKSKETTKEKSKEKSKSKSKPKVEEDPTYTVVSFDGTDYNMRDNDKTIYDEDMDEVGKMVNGQIEFN